MTNPETTADQVVNEGINTSSIASRTRRSSSLSNEKAKLPKKRPRRSSTRRKSLVETLASVSRCVGGSSVHTSPDDTSKQPDQTCDGANSNLPTSHNTASRLSSYEVDLPSNAEGVSDSDESPQSNFVLAWYNSLQKESNEWNSLLRQEKNHEEHEKTSSLRGDSLPENSSIHLPDVPESIDYEHFSKQVTLLEQRFSIAALTVSACLLEVHDLGIAQRTWLKDFMEKEATACLSESMSTDPRSIINDLFKYDEALSNCNASSVS